MNDSILNLILDAREERFKKQQYLIKKYCSSLIIFTINIPGANKNTEIVKSIFEIGKKEIIRILDLNEIDVLYLETSSFKASGPESFFVIEESAHVAKKLMIQLEISHPLGRLMDIDVMDTDLNITSRKNSGFTERKCFVCNKDAKLCARNKSHSLEKTINKFNQIYYDYLENKMKF